MKNMLLKTSGRIEAVITLMTQENQENGLTATDVLNNIGLITSKDLDFTLKG